MNHEFVTVYGKAIIEKDKLFIRSLDVPFSKTAFSQIAYELFFVVVFALQFFKEHGPMVYVSLLAWGVVFAFRLPAIYDVLFKRSYASRIALNKIKSMEIEEDTHGLQIFIILNLQNNRYRKIPFRKLENQYEPFTEVISHHLTSSQLA